MNRFEQLIEFVINDEEQKARDLFHDIVVEKSRQIYEDIMSEEDEVVEEDLGGDASADLIDDVESEEQTMNLEGEDMDDEEMSDMDDEEMSDMDGDEEMSDMDDDESFTMGDDDGSEPATKDDILNLEDKLDQLMSEFEDLLSGGDDMAGDDMAGDDMAGDDMAGDDMAEMMPMAEAISLKAAPKPVTSEEGGVYKKSAVAANSGAKGAVASPVKMTGDTAQGRPAPKAAEIGVGSSSPKQGPAPKPVTSQASGVNTKTPFPKG
jgi:hypothetical protein